MTSKQRLTLAFVVDVCTMTAIYLLTPPWSMVVAAVYGGWCYYLGYARGRMPR